MQQVLTQLETINANLDSIRGVGSVNTLADIYDKLENINDSISQGKDEVSNFYDKLDIIDSLITDVELAVNSVEHQLILQIIRINKNIFL